MTQPRREREDPVEKFMEAIGMTAFLGLCAFVFLVGLWISIGFKNPLGWILVATAGWFAFITSSIRLKGEIKTRMAERKKLENEAWLRSPEGNAWQEGERERQSKQYEEEERRRKEVDEAVAQAKWRQYYESKTMDEISTMGGTEFEAFLA